MKYKEIENKSLSDLIKQKSLLTEQLFQLKMKNSLGQLSNPTEIRLVRRNIARLNTAIVKIGVR